MTKTAIVTGATKGIGRATAIKLAQQGHWVLGVGRDRAEGATLQRELAEHSGGVFADIDLTADDAGARIVERAVAETGRVDVLVNNAGVNLPAPITEVTPELLDTVLGLNLRAAVLLSSAAIAQMRTSGGGVIVNVSSEAGVLGFPGQVAYNVSKAGLSMLTRSITAECAEQGIRAVTVSPGTTSTPLVAKLIDDAPDRQAMIDALQDRPAARLGRPEEIAEAICFAASDAVSYLTGSEIVIDGGRTAVG
ncbi:SDR family NAD(P)-dependent oxidoreductase [Ruania rhizosphaerae]|uniref:SDR family NAD(P)-dependent oxidoreductase n=1 Tax=Ruania rhizosphaerae TaxID=1840413 RepID=UPI00135B3B04|nr:SDR family oxidoreductase [Ruania rhizosphaerae]